jgi:hypothetical protein
LSSYGAVLHRCGAIGFDFKFYVCKKISKLGHSILLSMWHDNSFTISIA